MTITAEAEATGIARRLAYAHDASHFLVVPSEVSLARDVQDVARLLAASVADAVPLTFRSGGTSLSGQGVTGHRLVDTRRHFRSIEVLDGGARVRVGPGATVRQVNARLAPLGYRLGPDPASEAAATMGGVIANNSSGMLCGTQANAYQTLDSVVVVLPSGTIVDTGAPDADQRLRFAEPHLYAGLARLRDRVRGNPESMRSIRRLFSLKNTMGYAINAFADFEEPSQVLAHLMVGSEGTLGFIATATMRTVPVRGHVATGFLVFPSLNAATASLPELVDCGLAAIEVLDATSLRVAQRDPVSGRALPALRVERHAGLLVEFAEPTEDALAQAQERARVVLAGLDLVVPGELTTASRARADLWHVRKGLYAAVAGARPSGTTALLEDVAVPVPELAGTCEALTGLFDRHGYQESVIFGHAKDGNIHFMLNEQFDDPRSISRFTAFTQDMVELILGIGGTLKAEHGTGRMMAPFVHRQYGDELYAVMREVKALFDPNGILNPGVIINDDPTIHLQDLKRTPTVEAEVDRCVDCGFCEPVCPSRDLTLTPRQRIALRREHARAVLDGDRALAHELRQATDYQVVQTCAADGMCATACPVAIDTGALVKGLRARQGSWASRRLWGAAARHWAGATWIGARGLAANKRMPGLAMRASRLARRLGGKQAIPMLDPGLPTGGPPRRPRTAQDPAAVLMPACVGSMFGPEPGFPGATAAVLALCAQAGIEVAIPHGVSAACCGTPFSSKGASDAASSMRARMRDWLWTATDGGRLPVVVDASSCTEGLIGLLAGIQDSHGQDIEVVDALVFVRDQVLPHLPRPARLPSIVVHPTCSTTRLGLTPALLDLAGHIAETVHVPADWGCCGFAGDRGMLHPELTASATAVQAAQVIGMDAAAHASANRTCEIGMTRATGKAYVHVLEHLAAIHSCT